MKRRDILLKSFPALIATGSLPGILNNDDPTDDELMAEAELLRELDTDAFGWMWSILRGITDEELDWKIHPEANSTRWIIGHLNWFEEWASDAIKETGLYLIDEQPTNTFQADSLEEMKERFTQAREKYDKLTAELKASDIRRPAQYLYNDNDKKRAQVDLRTIIAIHSTHFYGHLYQIRMIRGTYSRANDTYKAKFDKW